MARILTIGDLHFQTRKLQFGIRVGKSIIEHLQNQPPNTYDAIVVLGDTLHYFGRLEVEAQVIAINLFTLLASYAPVHVLIGNHDRPNKNDFLTDFHPFEGLNGHNRIHIYHKPGWFQIRDYKFVAVPYVPVGRLGEALQHLTPAWDPSIVTAVFTHQDYKGGKGDNGQSMTRGDIWHENWCLAINGHLHEYQLIQHNLICPGAPAQHGHVGAKQRSISAFTFGPPQELGACNGHHGTNWRENRIFLSLPHLEEIIIMGEQVLQWRLPDDDNFYKLKIHCNKWECKALRSNSYIQQLEANARVSLFWESTDEIKIDIPSTETTKPDISSDFYTSLLELLNPTEQELVSQLMNQIN